MSRIGERFAELREQGRKALIPFITAGDPSPDFTVSAMHDLVIAGADLIELGVPFSDPMADGPVIQRASERALANQINLRCVLDYVEQFRTDDQRTPVVLMGYLNPIERMGYPEFAAAAQSAGVDGILTVDMPPEEANEMIGLLKARDLDPIFLLAPNSSAARVKKVSEIGGGFLYYVSLKGVTGASHLDFSEVERKVGEIRENTDLPIGVGFGVKDAETAASIARLADAVVVGSALIGKIESALGQDQNEIRRQIRELMSSMRTALDH